VRSRTEVESTAWCRLLQRTVWDASFMENDSPPRYRGIFRIVLPATYAWFLFVGTLGTISTDYNFAFEAGLRYAHFWTPMLAVISMLALVGLIFRLHWFELLATALLVVGVASFPLSAAGLAISAGNLNGWAMAAGFPAFLLLPGWRMFDLVTLIRKNRGLRMVPHVR